MALVNPKIKITYEDYCHLPEDKRYELIGGELFLVPSPSVLHQMVSANLEFILRRFVNEKGLGVVLYAPLDVLFTSTDVVQPDIIFISRTRQEIIKEANIQGAPDLIIEILSPSTSLRDQTIKKQLYAQHGVCELWLVNPIVQSTEVFNLAPEGHKEPEYYSRKTKKILKSIVLSGLEVNLDEVF